MAEKSVTGTLTIDELEGKSFEEILKTFDVSNEQAYDSECGGDSEADDGFPVLRPTQAVARKRRSQLSSRDNSSACSCNSGFTSTTSPSSSVSTTGASDNEYDDDEEIFDDPTVPPKIHILDCIESTSSSEESDKDEEVPNWKQGDGNHIFSKFSTNKFNRPFGPKPNFDPTKLKNFFCFFFNMELVTHIIEQSNLYASQKGFNLLLNVPELNAFIGILIIVGFHQLTSLRLYWSSNPNFHVARIARVMSLRRFLRILRYLHLNDNSKMPNIGTEGFDKLYKIRPFLNHFSNVFKEAFSPSRYLAVDESMIAFKGRSTLKQYMPMKPIKRGFKIWAICCSVTGYLLAFDFYTGKSGENKTSSLGERVVLDLSKGFELMGYCLFFDRFFSSFTLIKKLLAKGFYRCATILQNRKYFPKDLLKVDKQLKYGERDSCFSKIYGLVKWKDRGTKSVYVATSMHNPNATTTIKRKTKTGEKVDVECPTAIESHNTYMGGVDLFDQNMSYYSTQWKSRRWWLKSFYYMLDASIVNSYILYKETLKKGSQPSKVASNKKESHKPISHLMYRSNLADELIHNYCSRKTTPTPVTKTKIKKNVTVEASAPSGHMPIKCKQRRCGNCSTKKKPKKSVYKCETCDIALCMPNCFKAFHEKIF